MDNKVPKNFKESLKLAYEQQCYIEELLLKLKDEQEEKDKLRLKDEYYRKVFGLDELLSTHSIAEEFNTTGHTLNKILHELDIIYPIDGFWSLYKKYRDLGYANTKVKSTVICNEVYKFEVISSWTEKGREFIRQILIDNNIFPVE